MSIPTPPRCPRCGNEHFVRTQVRFSDVASFPAGKGVAVGKTALRCTVCLLTFDGDGWTDEHGEEWTMAESGT